MHQTTGIREGPRREDKLKQIPCQANAQISRGQIRLSNRTSAVNKTQGR